MKWNTPRLLVAGGVTICLGAILMLVAAVHGARNYRHSIQVIGRDSTPSIIAAERTQTALADMDASAAEQILGGPDAAMAKQTFEARRKQAAEAVVAAAENITYGDTEREPIRKLAVSLGIYAAMVQSAIDTRQPVSYRETVTYMDSRLLPAAAALEKANSDALEKTWSDQKAIAARSLLGVVAAALLLGGALLGLQAFLAGRTRRIFNTGLLAATAAAILFFILTVRTFHRTDDDLRIAREDAFDSMLALWQARSTAYSEKADQDRALADAPRNFIYKQAFVSKDQRVSNEITREMNNITFPGERELADIMQARYLTYVKLEKADKHRAALAAFAEFDRALGKVLDLNEREFNGAIERAFEDVARLETLAPAAALAIFIFGWIGLRPRLREYWS
jgi:hypothetical protein